MTQIIELDFGEDNVVPGLDIKEPSSGSKIATAITDRGFSFRVMYCLVCYRVWERKETYRQETG